MHLELTFRLLRGGVLEIGDKSGLSNASITCYEKITIGKNVLIGAGTQIFDTDFHPIISKYRFGDEKKNDVVSKKAVVIEDGVFIGSRAIILKGSHIGKNSIIGAGAVVSGYIPPNQIWAGVPAKYVGTTE